MTSSMGEFSKHPFDCLLAWLPLGHNWPVLRSGLLASRPGCLVLKPSFISNNSRTGYRKCRSLFSTKIRACPLCGYLLPSRLFFKIFDCSGSPRGPTLELFLRPPTQERCAVHPLQPLQWPHFYEAITMVLRRVLAGRGATQILGLSHCLYNPQ